MGSVAGLGKLRRQQLRVVAEDAPAMAVLLLLSQTRILKMGANNF